MARTEMMYVVDSIGVVSESWLVEFYESQAFKGMFEDFNDWLLGQIDEGIISYAN